MRLGQGLCRSRINLCDKAKYQLDQTVLLGAMRCDELLARSVALNQGREAPAAVVGSNERCSTIPVGVRAPRKASVGMALRDVQDAEMIPVASSYYSRNDTYSLQVHPH